MTVSNDPREQIIEELAEFGEQAKKHTIEQIRDGAWFGEFLRSSLSTYREEADIAGLRGMHPGLPEHQIASARIETAKRYSALEGAITSAAYTGAVSSTLGSMVSTAQGAIPEDAVPFVADLFYITRLRLHLAHDLCVLHEHPIDIDDAEDLHDLVRTAFGIKAGELLYRATLKLARGVADKGMKRTVDGIDEAVNKSLPVVGQHLLRRNVIKYAIPVVTVPLNAAFNFYFTGSIPHMANSVLGEKKDLLLEYVPSPKVLLEAIWLIIIADEKVSASESRYLNNLTRKLVEIEGGEETLNVLKEMEHLKQDEVLQRVSEESPEVRKTIYQVVCDTAAVDTKIHRKEKKILQRFAELCGETFDVKDLKKRAKTMKK